MEPVNQDQLTQMDVQLDLESRQHLFDASKWSKFLSVIVFIACALVLVFGIMGGKSIISAMEKFYPNQEMIGNLVGALLAILAFLVLVAAFIYFFLFQFATKVKSALATENADQLSSGIKSLKTFFIISTILAGVALLNSIINLFL